MLRVRSARAPHVACIVVLTALSALLCFYGLGSNGVHELDEAWQAQAALEMYQSGDLWRPTAFGRPFFSKPALPLWLMLGSYHVLGPTTVATRMWAALFAVAVVLATYLLGERLGGVSVGFLAGLSLTTGYIFVYKHCARTGEFDSMMVFLFVTATLLFHRALDTNRGWVLCAAVAGLASHAKNLAGLLPALVFILTLLACRPKHRPNLRQCIVCVLVFAAVNVAWIIPMTFVHGPSFLQHYVGIEVLNRPYRPGSHSIPDVTLIYLSSLLAGFSPWAFLGIAGLVEEARKTARQRDAGSVLLLMWSVVLAAVLCTVLRRGLQWYLIPTFPFLALSASRLLLDATDRPRWARWWRAAACLAALGLTICFEILPEASPFALWSISRPFLVWTDPTRAGSLVLVGIASMAAAALSSKNAAHRPTFSPRYYTWPTAAVLSAGAMLAVARPLASVDYENVYVRAREALAEAHTGNDGSLIVNLPWNRFDILTRYYFNNIDGFRASYVRNKPQLALARARKAPAPAFCVLISQRRPLHPPGGFPGRLIFSGYEPTPSGAPRIYVSVIVVESNVTSGTTRRFTQASAPGTDRRTSAAQEDRVAENEFPA